MSGINLVRVPQLAAAPYAYASTVSASTRFIFLAGACPLGRDGAVVAPGDIAAQTAQCVDNLVEALAAAGASLADVVATRVLVASSRQRDLVAAWDVVHDRFGDHDVPSTLLGVAALGYTGQLVEIEATAGVIDSK